MTIRISISLTKSLKPIDVSSFSFQVSQVG